MVANTKGTINSPQGPPSKELTQSHTTAQLAQLAAHQEAQHRASAQELAHEAESKAQEALNQLATIQARAINAPTQSIQQTIQQAQQAENYIDLDERETRCLIDRQLQAAGWEADSEQLTYQNGTRPQKGRNIAISEWLTEDGRADYALFAGLQVVAVVEAKRQRKDVSGAIDH